LFDARQAVTVLVALDDFFFEQFARALIRQHAGDALPEVAAAPAAPLRHVHDEPMRPRTDARVPDAAFHQIFAAMRADRLAVRARRFVAQPARRGDFLLAADLKCFESWNPYDRLLS